MPSASDIKARLKNISPVEDRTYYVEDAFATAHYQMEQALKSICEDYELLDVDRIELVDETESGGIWEAVATVRCGGKLFRVKTRAETDWIYVMTFPEVEEVKE